MLEQKYIESREVAEMDKPKVVYLLLAKDKSVKVGVTRDLEKRKNQLQNTSGKEIIDCFATGYCSNPYFLERLFKNNFVENRIVGEWYHVDFEVAKSFLTDIYISNAVKKKKEKDDGIERLLDFIFS